MTRKRYVKLLMAAGWSRNEANEAAKEVRDGGNSYHADYYRGCNAGDIYTLQNQEPYEAVKQAVDAMMPSVKRMVEAIAAGVLAFSEAVSRMMNAVDAE